MNSTSKESKVESTGVIIWELQGFYHCLSLSLKGLIQSKRVDNPVLTKKNKFPTYNASYHMMYL